MTTENSACISNSKIIQFADRWFYFLGGFGGDRGRGGGGRGGGRGTFMNSNYIGNLLEGTQPVAIPAQ